MYEKKISKTEKVELKDLTIMNGVVIDGEGVIVDLNKVVKIAFEEGDIFTFSLVSKKNNTETIGEAEDGEEDDI